MLQREKPSARLSGDVALAMLVDRKSDGSKLGSDDDYMQISG